jgi:hypothetical protein
MDAKKVQLRLSLVLWRTVRFEPAVTDGRQTYCLATEHVLNMSANPVRPENCLIQCSLNKCFGLMGDNQADQEYKNVHTVIWTWTSRPLTTSVVTLNVCNIKAATLRTKIEYFEFFTNLSEKFLTLRRTERDTIKMYVGFPVKYPLFLSDFNETLNYLDRFFLKTLKYQISPKSAQGEPNCSMRTVRHEEANSRFSHNC